MPLRQKTILEERCRNGCSEYESTNCFRMCVREALRGRYVSPACIQDRTDDFIRIVVERNLTPHHDQY